MTRVNLGLPRRYTRVVGVAWEQICLPLYLSLFSDCVGFSHTEGSHAIHLRHLTLVNSNNANWHVTMLSQHLLNTRQDNSSTHTHFASCKRGDASNETRYTNIGSVSQVRLSRKRRVINYSISVISNQIFFTFERG